MQEKCVGDGVSLSREIWSPAKYGPRPEGLGSQNRSALLISVRPGALELNKNLNYRGLVDSNPVVDIDADKDVLLLLLFYWVLLLKI